MPLTSASHFRVIAAPIGHPTLCLLFRQNVSQREIVRTNVVDVSGARVSSALDVSSGRSATGLAASWLSTQAFEAVEGCR